MLVCTSAGCNDFTRAARRLQGACPWSAVTSCNGYHYPCIHSVVESVRKQVIITMVAAAERKIENIHFISDGGIDSVKDVLAASVINIAREDIVVTQPRARCYAGHVIDAHAVEDRNLASNSSRDSSGMRPVVLDCLGVESLLVGLVIEDLGNNHFWRDVITVLVLVVRIAVCCIALGEASRVGKTSRIEERVRLVDTRVDVSNLNARPCDGSAAGSIPSIHCIDDLITLAQVGMIQGVVLGPLYHWCGCNRLQRRPVKLNRDCVERDIILTGYSCPGRVGSEPPFELVASSRELGAVRSHGVII